MRLTRFALLVTLLGGSVAFLPRPATAANTTEWLVLLNDPPVVKQFRGRIERTRAAAEPYRQHLLQTQANLRPQIEATHARVTGALQRLLNGMIVVATPQQAAALRQLPGVKSVMHIRRYHKSDQLSLSNVEQAWSSSAVGGESNAGAGIKIGIIDTGIDQNLPAFQDSSLQAPSGYPVADNNTDLAFTNSKVIVARSYVGDIVYQDLPSAATDTASASRPDDLTARDLDGHGTAVAATAAGVSTTYNGVAVVGVAPKAYLGNYKVFGSDEVNPNGSGNILQAVEDAYSDGMDVINLSLGSSPYNGPLDTDPTYCASNSSVTGNIPIPADACDPLAYELENAMDDGLMIVVAAAGNEGANGYQFNYGCGAPPCYSQPTFGTIDSPAYAPSVIAVGGIQNDVTYVQRVEVTGLSPVDAYESYDGPPPDVPVTAPLADATQSANSLCSPVGPTVFTGEIVLVQQGACDDVTMVTNAQTAGAVGVIEIANTAEFYFPYGLAGTSIPTFIVTQNDGATLKSYIAGHAGANATMDPKPYQEPATSQGLAPYSVAYFSSRGPVNETEALKPDLVAAATDFLLPMETDDAYGELFDYAGYGTTQGTSFATPMVTGSAALVKQAHPNLTPAQVKSALVNTASASSLTTSDTSAQASISEVGAGLLQTNGAVTSTVYVSPSAISFGAVGVNLITSQALTLYNTSSGQVQLAMNVTQNAGYSTSVAQVLVNNAASTTVTVPGGSTANPGSTTVTVTLTGGAPPAGRYEGVITAIGGPVALTIPYMFVYGDGVPYDVIPLNDVQPGQGYVAFDGAVGAQIPWYQACPGTINTCIADYGAIAIQVVDQFGVPVANYPVSWAVTQGDGLIVNDPNYTDFVTNSNGIAGATASVGDAGPQEFTATVGSMSMPFDGYARVPPAINAGGIVDGANFTLTSVAPGSWISVFGTNMSDTTQGNNGINGAFADCALCNVVNQSLPMGIDGTAFSFDSPSLTYGYPGRFSYVSPTQLNIQVPWELQGVTSATVKVMVNYTYSAEYTLSLAAYSPGFFIIDTSNNSVAAEDVNYKVVNTSNPVARGSAVQLFLNGLGPVTNQPADGAGAPATNLARTTITPTVTIGGQNATVEFSGLAPYYASLYQVNVDVPSGIGTGLQPIVLSIGGVTAKTGYLAVK
ncbi:MAG TPA: S8 family serine peptidase [Bryobacteraceae bacterium]|nr:S8 family serine peptidase [Bryobacteraceae bacterium]